MNMMKIISMIVRTIIGYPLYLYLVNIHNQRAFLLTTLQQCIIIHTNDINEVLDIKSNMCLVYNNSKKTIIYSELQLQTISLSLLRGMNNSKVFLTLD